MSVPCDGLAIRGVAHTHVTCNNFITLLGKGHNFIIGVVVTPCGDEHGILVVVGKAVFRSIVDGKQGLERQSLDKPVHVVDDACVELELAAHVGSLTSEIAVCNGILLGGLCTTGEILTIEEVERLAQHGKSLRGIGVDHVDRNQRSSVFREVWTHGRSLAPEITLVGVGVVERSTGVGKALDYPVDHEVHITTYAEAVGVVVLSRSEVEEVFDTIVVDIGIEVGTSATTLDFQRTFRAVVCLADIVVGIVVDVGIAVGVKARGMVVDIHLGVSRVESVVDTCLIVEGHVLSRTQILGKLLGHMPTRVGVGHNLQAIHLAALGGDEDGTLGSLGTVEHHGLCTLEESNLLDLGRKHVVGWALHAVDDDKREVAVVVSVKTVVVHTPKVAAVPSAYERIHVVKTAHRIILLLQFFHVDIGNASKKMVGILVAESNMDFLFCHDSGIGLVSDIVSALGKGCQRRNSKHGKEKYVCFYTFHKNVLLIINRLSLIINPCLTILDSGQIPRKDRYPCQEAGTSSASIPNDG